MIFAIFSPQIGGDKRRILDFFTALASIFALISHTWKSGINYSISSPVGWRMQHPGQGAISSWWTPTTSLQAPRCYWFPPDGAAPCRPRPPYNTHPSASRVSGNSRNTDSGPSAACRGGFQGGGLVPGVATATDTETREASRHCTARETCQLIHPSGIWYYSQSTVSKYWCNTQLF